MGAGLNDNDGDEKPEDRIEGESRNAEQAADEAAAAIEESTTDAGAPDGEPVDDAGRLDLKDTDERLPWLESEDDADEGQDSGAGRAAGIVLGAIAGLVLLVGLIWWVSHRATGPEQVAEGGVIEAPEQAYKEAPKDPGGKTFEGTGDTSFAVSEGQTRPARLGQATPAAKPADAAPKPAAGAPAAPVSGVGVQIAAYSNEAQAKAGWDRLSGQYEALKGVSHRIQEGKADIGTVYRLQAVAPDAGAAQALCGKLKSAGLACQVKN